MEEQVSKLICITKIDDTELKAKIADMILHKLPQWFGIEKSILEYINGLKEKYFYAAYNNDNVVGFVSLKINNKYTGEIYVIGVLEEFHRCGIGKKLIKKIEDHLKEDKYKYMMVKTLGDSCDYEPYKRTRMFYESIGFYPIEELKEIWDEENPCLIMVKSIEN